LGDSQTEIRGKLPIHYIPYSAATKKIHIDFSQLKANFAFCNSSGFFTRQVNDGFVIELKLAQRIGFCQ